MEERRKRMGRDANKTGIVWIERGCKGRKYWRKQDSQRPGGRSVVHFPNLLIFCLGG